jgi:hypothetical protein
VLGLDASVAGAAAGPAAAGPEDAEAFGGADDAAFAMLWSRALRAIALLLYISMDSKGSRSARLTFGVQLPLAHRPGQAAMSILPLPVPSSV